MHTSTETTAHASTSSTRSTHTVACFRRALVDAGVRGRTSARTHEALRRLCAQHSLLGLRLDEQGAVRYTTPYLPDDVMELVCKSVVSCAVEQLDALVERNNKPRAKAKPDTRVLLCAEAAARTLMALSCASRKFRDWISASSSWVDLLRAFAACSTFHARDADLGQRLVASGELSAKRALELVAFTGCELCGAKAIRKVHWPFRVRCCRDCLFSRTISAHELRVEYGVASRELQELPKLRAELYRRGLGSYSCDFYWRTDVVDVLSRKHARTFATLHDAYAFIHQRSAGARIDHCCTHTSDVPSPSKPSQAATPL